MDRDALNRATMPATIPFGLVDFMPVDSSAALRLLDDPQETIDEVRPGEPLGEELPAQSHWVSEATLELEAHDYLVTGTDGNGLPEEEPASPRQIEAALRDQKTNPETKIGEVFLAEKLISPCQLQQALDKQAQGRRKPLGEILLHSGVISRNTLKRVLAAKLGIPYVSLKKFPFAPEAAKVIPERLARRYSVAPLFISDRALIVAVDDPNNWQALLELTAYTDYKIHAVMASPSDIVFALHAIYASALEFAGSLAGKRELSSDVQALASEPNADVQALASELSAGVPLEFVAPDDEQVSESDNTLVRFVNEIIIAAYRSNASDIHVEARDGRSPIKVRFRKDGQLTDYVEVPPAFKRSLVSRLKIMANLDITEKRNPQDGKIDFAQFGPARVSLRMVTIPTINGNESVVLRLLTHAKPVALNDLGLGADYAKLVELIERPHGLFLVCGPTGAGKTTSLHSMLAHLNRPDRKIWTAEDPVEIVQDGLNQVQVNPKIGWTFAGALRSFLRADPDIIMVGEMRDEETTQVAIQASLTGHLVLSTLHTNSASETVARLLDLGMDPFNFGDALRGVLAQRLVRRLCGCKRPVPLSEEYLHALALDYSTALAIPPKQTMARWRAQYADATGQVIVYTPGGCERCAHRGYSGRLPVFELLIATPAIRSLVQARAPASAVLAQAIKEGMRPLKQAGFEQVLAGHTSFTEMRAACQLSVLRLLW